MRKAKITMGISLPNNVHAIFDKQGRFSRLLKVDSKVNLLEYIGLLNKVYEKQAIEEDYKQRIININDKKESNKSVKKVVFLILLVLAIIITILTNTEAHIFTMSNILKFLVLVLGGFAITNVGVSAFLGSNKTLDKHVKYLENELRKTRKEKQKLLSLCKEKEQEFAISEIPLEKSYRIENSINHEEKNAEEWFADVYNEKDNEINIYRMSEQDAYLLTSIEKYYYDSLNRNIVDKLANKEGDVEFPIKYEWRQERISKILKKLEEEKEKEKVYVKK